MNNKQEMGLARYEAATIMPVVLEDGSEAQLVSVSLDIPDEFIYYIGKGPDGEKRGGILSSMWAVVSREMCINYPEIKILEESDKMIKLEIHNAFLNTHGQVVRDTTIVKIDSEVAYKESRLKWMPKKWDSQERCYVEDSVKVKELQSQGYLIDTIVYDEYDVPKAIKRKLPPEIERELMLNYLTIQKNLFAKADTVGKRKLTQRACGFNGIKMPDKKGKEQVSLQIYNIMRRSGVPVHPNEVKVQREVIDLSVDEVDEPGTKNDRTEEQNKMPEELNKGQEERKIEEKLSESSEMYSCSVEGCDKKFKSKTYNYAMEHFGRSLCFDHQQEMKAQKKG